MKGWRLPLLLVLLLVGGRLSVRMASPAPTGRSVNPLLPCPPSPNCVCSEDPDPARRTAPLAFTGPASEAMARLRSIVSDLPRTRVVNATEDRLQVEFRTRFLGFVDDMEFRLDAGARVIHVRSASRLGYSDFGTNRRRVEGIRSTLVLASQPGSD